MKEHEANRVRLYAWAFCLASSACMAATAEGPETGTGRGSVRERLGAEQDQIGDVAHRGARRGILPARATPVRTSEPRAKDRQIQLAWSPVAPDPEKQPFAPSLPSGPRVIACHGLPRAAQPYLPMVEASARRHGLDSALVLAVIDVESDFNPRAVSSKGAMGLMQLMPGTARDLGVTKPFDPAQNIAGGTHYLAMMLAEFGDIRLALAAYNAGPKNVCKYGGVPPFAETRAYVKEVIAQYAKYRALDQKSTASKNPARN